MAKGLAWSDLDAATVVYHPLWDRRTLAVGVRRIGREVRDSIDEEGAGAGAVFGEIHRQFETEREGNA